MPRILGYLVNSATAGLTGLALLLGGLQVWRQWPLWTGRETPQIVRVERWRQAALGGRRIGPAAAVLTIVEFLDYQCPFCRKAAGVLRQLQFNNPSQVAIVLRQLPGHDQSLHAAIAAECAGRAGHFAEYHDRLFQLFDSLGAKRWTDIAHEVGVEDTNSFTRCLADSVVTATIDRDKRAAGEFGITGTPTFLINDRLYVGFSDAPSIETAVADELKRAIRRSR